MHLAIDALHLHYCSVYHRASIITHLWLVCLAPEPHQIQSRSPGRRTNLHCRARYRPPAFWFAYGWSCSGIRGITSTLRRYSLHSSMVSSFVPVSSCLLFIRDPFDTTAHLRVRIGDPSITACQPVKEKSPSFSSHSPLERKPS